MPSLKKTFIIALTIALSCLLYFGFIELLYILDGDLITNEDFIVAVINTHHYIATFILYLGYSSALLACGSAGLMLWRKR